MSFGRDSDPRFGSFVLRGDCPTCAGSLPVNGAVESVVCGACGESVSVPGRILRDLLDDFEAGWPRPPSAGMARVGAVQWRWTSRPLRAPVCPGCGGAVAGTIASLNDRLEAEERFRLASKVDPS